MKATVLNTVSNDTKVVELDESVSTVSDLKHFLDLEEGSRLFESVTHTNLENNDSSLPTLPESKQDKGYVFFVSPAQNKIKNGAYDRQTCYRLIKENHLQDRVKSRFGRNFTQVATDALNQLLDDFNTPEGAVTAASTGVPDPDAGKITTEKELLSALATALFNVAEGASNSVSEEVKAHILAGIERVFPNPYSVQDLSNMK